MPVSGILIYSRNYPFLSLVFGSSGIDWKSAIKVALLSLILPAFVVVGSHIDGTWSLPGNGRGLGRHYGVWVLFSTTPIIVLLTGAALVSFHRTMRQMEIYSASGRIPKDLRRKISRHLYLLSLRGPIRYVLWVLMLAGLGCGYLNIRQTLDPMSTYGNDVFDAYPYMWGFLFNKIYLCSIWTFVYPAAIFITVHITISMISILRYMCDHKMLRIDFFHPDNCGGVSVFGSINTLVLSVWAVIFVVIASLFLTHANNYDTLVVALFFTSVVFIAQSFAAVFYIHRFVTTKKHESIQVINEKLNEEMRTSIFVGRFSSNLLSARNHVLSIRTFPYARPALAIVNTIRFLPALLALAKLAN